MDISEDTMLEVGILEDKTITIIKHQDSKQKEPRSIPKHAEISKEDDHNNYNPLDEVF